MTATESLPLSNLPDGARGTVDELTGGHRFRQRIGQMGLAPGVDFEVFQDAGGIGPIGLRIDGAEVYIGRGMADQILVRTDAEIVSRRTLFDLVTGDRARIVRIRGGGPTGIRQRLLDMGITRGTELLVERHAPLGDPVEIEVKGYHLALRMDEARRIEVEDVS